MLGIFPMARGNFTEELRRLGRNIRAIPRNVRESGRGPLSRSGKPSFEYADDPHAEEASGGLLIVAESDRFASLALPAHYDPGRVSEVWRVPYNDLAPQAVEWAKRHGIAPAGSDEFRVALVLVDVQNTFCTPGFELYVGDAAVGDSRRLCEFIYRNLHAITQISVTLDTHQAMQIFHPVFFVDGEGRHPSPGTTITRQDIEAGVWRLNNAVAYSLANGDEEALRKHIEHYVACLEQSGRYALTVWPYHAMLGGIGYALVSAVEEACFFHNIARNSQTDFQIKGNHPLTENYSVLKPEVTTGADGRAIASRNEAFLDRLLSFDRIIIAGQAKSHCVAWTVDDLLDEVKARDPKLAGRIYLLEDCSSPVIIPGVVDFTEAANQAFERFRRAGVHVVRSTDPVSEWPDFGP